MIKKLKHKLNNDANLRELLSGSAITFIMRIGGMGLGYLTILIIARKYGAEGTGIYSLTSQTINSLAIIGTMGMNMSVLRYVGQYANKEGSIIWLKNLYKKILQFSLPFTLIISVLVFLFAQEIAIHIFDNSTYTNALKLGAIILPFFTINLIDVEFIRGLKRLKISEFLRSVNRQTIVLILVLFVVFGYEELDPVIALIIGFFCTFLFSASYIARFFKKSKNNTNNTLTLLPRRELLKTSTPMLVITFSTFLFGQSGSLFLEAYATTDQVGIYNVCLQLALLVSLVLTVVNTISAPKFSELFWDKKMKELQRVINQSNKMIFFGSLGVAFFLMIFSKFVLGFFGQEFTGGIFVLLLLIFAQLINAITGSTGTFLMMGGYQAILRNIVVITAVISVIGFLILVPVYGMIGVAIIAVLSSIILNITSAAYIYKKIGLITFYNPFKPK